MPIYEFLCEACGPFEQRRSFKESGEPMRCPRCRAAAKRIYSIPGLVKAPVALSRAMLRAEKSAQEPEVVRRGGSGEPARLHASHGRPWTLGH